MILDVSDLAPREGYFGGKLIILLVDIQPKRIDPQPQLCTLLVLNHKVVDAVHFQVLCNLQVFQFCLFSETKIKKPLMTVRVWPEAYEADVQAVLWRYMYMYILT